MKIRLGLACFVGLLLLGCRAKDNFLKEAENLALFFGLLQNGRVVDSGQVKCYDGGGVPVNCGNPSWPRQDADYIGVPKPRSVSRPIRINHLITGESSLVTFDYGTGLLWTSCRLQTGGLPDSSADCVDSTAGDFSHEMALVYCKDLNRIRYGGRSSGWRLPSVRELRSLVDYGIVALGMPRIDNTSFPDTSWNIDVWTESSDIALNFDTGRVTTSPSSSGAVLCVNGPRMTAGRFTYTTDGAVKDIDTGLVFTRCANGQDESNDCAGSGVPTFWSAALQGCANLSKGGRSWRLPAIHELEVLLASTVYPFIDTGYFPNPPDPANIFGFWTSTTTTNIANEAFKMFEGGFYGTPASYGENSKSGAGPTYRCVAGP